MAIISIIIPTYQEAENIQALIAHLKKSCPTDAVEIIVVDGGSEDKTLLLAEQAGARSCLSPKKGRAAQMNYGASLAVAPILYFVHADSFPPASFTDDITKAVAAGFLIGRYQTRFNSNKKMLRLNAFFTRFDLFMCYGGDQTLFMQKKLFHAIGGFNAGMAIMEDYEIVVRARKAARYKIFPGKAIVSARKYDTNSWFKVQKANFTIVQMYKKGAGQEAMVHKYRELLHYR